MRYLILIFTVFLSFQSLAQFKLAPQKYWIQFTDKNNSKYSLDFPNLFLSERAIERRERYNIDYSFSDLPVNQNYKDSLVKLGFNVLNISKWLNGAIVQTDDTTLLEKVTHFSFVKPFLNLKIAVSKNIPSLKKNTEVLLNNHSIQNLFSVYDYGDSFNQIELSNGQVLHSKGFDGKGMLIAVIDAGFYKVNSLNGFDSLWANNQIIATRDFVKGNFAPVSYTGSTHGMQVLSNIGGNIPGKLIGTAPKANFCLLRSEDANSENIIEEFNWTVAAEYADSLGVDVINTSLGYSIFDDPTKSHTYADLDGKTTVVARAATLCARKGILVVASAGNDGDSDWKYIASPADADSILTVGSVDNAGSYSSFSSIGPSADWRTKPNVMAKGAATTVQSPSGGITVSYGTSFSSPVMAGMVASLWQAFPKLTNQQIIKAIELFSDQYENPTPSMGYGIPDFAKTFLYLEAIQNTHFEDNKPYRIYPNPAHDKFNIDFYTSEKNTFQIEIRTTLGQIEYTNEFEMSPNSFQHFEIDELINKSSGIYIIRISTEKRIYQEKILIN